MTFPFINRVSPGGTWRFLVVGGFPWPSAPGSSFTLLWPLPCPLYLGTITRWPSGVLTALVCCDLCPWWSSEVPSNCPPRAAFLIPWTSSSLHSVCNCLGTVFAHLPTRAWVPFLCVSMALTYLFCFLGPASPPRASSCLWKVNLRG